MGEKPMGAPSDEDQDVEDDPMAAAGGINTTRSNIKHASGVAQSGETGGAGDAGIAIKEQGVR